MSFKWGANVGETWAFNPITPVSFVKRPHSLHLETVSMFTNRIVHPLASDSTYCLTRHHHCRWISASLSVQQQWTHSSSQFMAHTVQQHDHRKVLSQKGAEIRPVAVGCNIIKQLWTPCPVLHCSLATEYLQHLVSFTAKNKCHNHGGAGQHGDFPVQGCMPQCVHPSIHL